MNHYYITVIYGAQRMMRNVIAHNSIQATRIGLAMMSQLNEPCAIICKPAERSIL
jgi:hypothetical protein